MNFEKVSEGLIKTIEKLSQAQPKTETPTKPAKPEAPEDTTVTGMRAKARQQFEIAMDPKAAVPEPAPKAAVPAVTKTIEPIKPKKPAAPKKAEPVKFPTTAWPGGAMSPQEASRLKADPAAKAKYMKQVSPAWEPKKNQPS